MTIMYRRVAVSAVLFLSLAASLHAKEKANPELEGIKHPLKPMLWKIEGKGLKKSSYLFGTIHISDPRATTLHPVAQKAFDAAAAVYTEIDLSPAKQMEGAAMFIRKGDASLAELVGDKTLADIRMELKAINPALDVKPFEKLKVWAIAGVLPQLKHQLQGKKPLDMQLWERAQKAGKKTGALEVMKEQLGQFDKFTAAEQKEFLGLTLKMLKLGREQGKDPNQEIIDAYLKGDGGAISQTLVRTSYMGVKMSSELHKKFKQLLLYERNKNMADTITKALSQPDAGSMFFAAGTAHYLGEKSVNHYLKESGFTVTPVTR